MAIGLYCITVTASVSQHQFFWRSMTTGLLARAALIGSIYKRGVNMTGKARTNFPNSALVNHISTDVSRIDACAQWFVSGIYLTSVYIAERIDLLGSMRVRCTHHLAFPFSNPLA